jgi:DNA-binding HxlR family transcriptional regulator
LRGAWLVVLGANGYSLGDEGRSLLSLLLPLAGWADRWAASSP